MKRKSSDVPGSNAADEILTQLRRQNRLLKMGMLLALSVPATLLLMGARDTKAKASFAEIDVGRINIVSEDGAKSMVLAARGLLPGPVVNGEVVTSDRGDKPGMVFYNGVGDEVGGLIYEGRLDKNGKPAGGVHLSMDRFGGDQQVAMHHYEGGGFMETGLSVFDRGMEKDYGPIYEQYLKAPAGAEKDALLARWKAAGGRQTTRLFVGRTRGESSALILADATGNPRIMMTVTPQGEASLDFMDDQGNVIQSLPEKTDAAK